RGGAALADVIAGHVPAIFLPVTTVGEHVRSGALVALAISSKTRSPVLPNVPTFAESGYPELVLSSWFGLSGPRKLSPDIVARSNREARAFLKEPQMKKLAENDASAPLDADAAGFARHRAAEADTRQRGHASLCPPYMLESVYAASRGPHLFAFATPGEYR